MSCWLDTAPEVFEADTPHVSFCAGFGALACWAGLLLQDTHMYSCTKRLGLDRCVMQACEGESSEGAAEKWLARLLGSHWARVLWR